MALLQRSVQTSLDGLQLGVLEASVVSRFLGDGPLETPPKEAGPSMSFRVFFYELKFSSISFGQVDPKKDELAKLLKLTELLELQRSLDMLERIKSSGNVPSA